MPASEQSPLFVSHILSHRNRTFGSLESRIQCHGRHSSSVAGLAKGVVLRNLFWSLIWTHLMPNGMMLRLLCVKVYFRSKPSFHRL